MGGYTSKCEKKSKSLHPNIELEGAERLLQPLFYGEIVFSYEYIYF
jgi:hypothetical protein